MNELFQLQTPYPLPKLKRLPLREQPAYRVTQDPDACNLLELLAALVGGPQQIEIAEALLGRFGSVRKLHQAHIVEIGDVHGIGPQTAIRLKAALALGKKAIMETEDERPTIHSPADAAALVQYEMSLMEQEYLKVMLLDTRNRVIDVVEVYHGSLNSAQVRIAELFKPAIQRMAAGVIVIHSHPSGDPTPSPDDVTVTRAIIHAGQLLDITCLDHIVIGHAGRYVSLKERGLAFDSGRVSESRWPYRLNEKACTCPAYPFPHRLYGGKCQGPDTCAHGMRLPHHPDYDPSLDECTRCDLDRRADEQFDRLHDEGLAVHDEDEVIYAYTRAQALEDGVLVDVSTMAKQAGFLYPTVITADLHAALTPNVREHSFGQSYEGRLWDVLFVASRAARRAIWDSQTAFDVGLAVCPAPRGRLRRRTLHLWIVIGPGDNGEPVVTIGFPEDF